MQADPSALFDRAMKALAEENLGTGGSAGRHRSSDGRDFLFVHHVDHGEGFDDEPSGAVERQHLVAEPVTVARLQRDPEPLCVTFGNRPWAATIRRSSGRVRVEKDIAAAGGATEANNKAVNAAMVRTAGRIA